MPVKEYQIVEYFLGSALKDEVMKIMPVQKQTRAGQRTRFKVGGGEGGRVLGEEVHTPTRLTRSGPQLMFDGRKASSSLSTTLAILLFLFDRPSSWSVTSTATSAWASSAPRR